RLRRWWRSAASWSPGSWPPPRPAAPPAPAWCAGWGMIRPPHCRHGTKRGNADSNSAVWRRRPCPPCRCRCCDPPGKLPMKNWLRENRGFVVFLLCFGFFRTAIADYNPIPSGSMRPTLLEGDVVLVNRLAYDAKIPLTDISLARLAEPQRGDVVTF